MTLQDAQYDNRHYAHSEPSATPIDLTEMPTNPLLPGVVPANSTPTTLAQTTDISGPFARSEIIPLDTPIPIDAPTEQAQIGSFANGSAPFIAQETPVPPTIVPVPLLTSSPNVLPASPYSPFPPLQPTRSKRLDAKAILAICAALLLLVLSAGGLIVNFVYYQPYRLHAAATATGIAIPTASIRAEQTYVTSYEHTQVAQQQATASAEQNIYTQATSGKPFVSDSLSQQSASGWDEGTIWQNSSCTFKNGSYVVYQPNTDYFLPCLAENLSFANFALQVDVHILQGDDGGIMFRCDSNSYAGYIFDIDNYGNYDLYSFTNKGTSLFNSQSEEYHTDQTNRLTIVARGNTFYFYLNQHFVDSTTDKTFGEGTIGLLASDSQDATTVAYTNLKVWLLY